jgi:hypothetical protein
MPNFYDDSKFGVISRKWFGLTKKWGGDVANGYSLNAVTHGATSVTHLAKWYPRGPIRITKAGSFCLATLTNASSDLHKARLKTRGASASMGVLWYIKSTSTAPAPAAFASNVPDKGTRVQATTTGTIAFFADYVAKFDSSGKWDA